MKKYRCDICEEIFELEEGADIDHCPHCNAYFCGCCISYESVREEKPITPPTGSPSSSP